MSLKIKCLFLLLALAIAGVVLVVVRSRATPERSAKSDKARTLSGSRTRSQLRTPELLGEMDSESEAPSEAELFVSGTVVDQQGRPVDGATVIFDSGSTQTFEASVDGSFIADKLKARPYLVSARFEDMVSRPVRVLPKDSSTDLTLTLIPSPALEVVATSLNDHRAISGATVQVQEDPTNVVKTDATGRALLRGVGAGLKIVRIAADGFATELRPLEVPFEGRGKEILHVMLAPAVSVSGVVLDETGRPIEKAQIVAQHAASVAEVPASDVAISDAQGRFELRGLAPGLYRFQASHVDFATSTTPQQRIAERGAQTLDIRISAGGRVLGQVLSQSPSKERILVRFTSPDGGFGKQKYRDVACDQAGFFEARGLPRAKLQAVAVRRRESSEPVSVDLQGTDVVSGVRLELASAGTIRGVVVSESNEPVAQAIVSARALDEESEPRSGSAFGSSQSVASDERGNFELVGLTAKQYAVFATPPGGTSAGARAALRDGYRVEVGMTIKLTLPDDGAIRGVVRLSDGSAPGSFAVSLDQSAPMSMLSEDGSFRLEALPPGEHTLRVSGNFPTKIIHGINVPSASVADVGTITVDAGSTLSGRVVTPDGQPVASATVMVAQNFVGDGQTLASPGTTLQTDQRHAITDTQGNFALHGLGPSARFIAAEHPGKGRAQARPVPQGRDPVVLVLEATGTISGRVTSGGQPLEGILLAATSRTETASDAPAQALGALTGPDGEYTIDNVPPGSYKVVAMKRSGGSAANGKVIDVTVTAQDPLRLDIDLPAGSVTVVVRSEAKAPRRLVLSGPTSQVGELKSEKPVRFSDVLPGEYKICSMDSASENAGEPTCQNVRVAATPPVQEFRVN